MSQLATDKWPTRLRWRVVIVAGLCLIALVVAAFVLQGVVLIALAIALRPLDLPAEAKALAPHCADIMAALKAIDSIVILEKGGA